jgi:hypothetical protein
VKQCISCKAIKFLGGRGGGVGLYDSGKERENGEK